jgi:hypothetical protein
MIDLYGAVRYIVLCVVMPMTFSMYIVDPSYNVWVKIALVLIIGMTCAGINIIVGMFTTPSRYFFKNDNET